MRFRDGYLRVGRFGRAPIRIHWSTPVGAFVLCGFGFAPGAWLGFLVLVLAHEIGHALLVRAFQYEVVSIDVHGLGGRCAWEGGYYVTNRQRAIIAWGGILMQLAILLSAPLWSRLLPSWRVAEQLQYTLTATNLVVILGNLLPIRGLDGAEAWRVFRR